jgi:molybdopterin synthase sulfur carrier subunit
VIRVVLPVPLRRLARIDGEVHCAVEPPVTQRLLLDVLEAQYPELRGTLRDHETQRRRAYVRFFANGRDVSNEPPDTLLPDAVTSGDEPFVVLGALSGG